MFWWSVVLFSRIGRDARNNNTSVAGSDATSYNSDRSDLGIEINAIDTEAAAYEEPVLLAKPEPDGRLSLIPGTP